MFQSLNIIELTIVSYLLRSIIIINGIENFWNQAKRHLRKFNGIPKAFPINCVNSLTQTSEFCLQIR